MLTLRHRLSSISTYGLLAKGRQMSDVLSAFKNYQIAGLAYGAK